MFFFPDTYHIANMVETAYAEHIGQVGQQEAIDRHTFTMHFGTTHIERSFFHLCHLQFLVHRVLIISVVVEHTHKHQLVNSL